MSLWEFNACCEGVRVANGGKTKSENDLSTKELAEMGIEGFGDG